MAHEEPRHAFILMMDHAPRSNAWGATRIMGEVQWMSVNRPEYRGLRERWGSRKFSKVAVQEKTVFMYLSS